MSCERFAFAQLQDFTPNGMSQLIELTVSCNGLLDEKRAAGEKCAAHSRGFDSENSFRQTDNQGFTRAASRRINVAVLFATSVPSAVVNAASA